MKQARYRLILIVFCLFLCADYSFSNQDNSSKFNSYLNQTWRWNNFTTLKGLPPSVTIKQFIESNDGVTYAVTTGGIFWFNNYLWKQIEIEGVNFKELINVSKDSEEGIVLLYKNKIYEVDKTKVKTIDLKVPITQKSYTSVVEIKNERYILTVVDSKTKKFNLELYENGVLKDFNSIVKTSEKEKHIVNYILDENGGVLVVNEENLYYWREDVGKKVLPVKPEDVFYSNIIERNDGTIYLVSLNPRINAGLYHYNPFTNKLIKTELDIHRFVTGRDNNSGHFYAIMTNNKVLYAQDGINFRELENANPLLYDATNISFSRDGNMWVSHHDQVYYVTLNSNRWNYYDDIPELSNLNINSIIKSKKDNSFWIGTSIGVYHVKSNKVLAKYEKFGGMNLLGITSVCEDDNGSIYFCSGGFLDYVYRIKNGKIEKLDEKYGVPKSRFHKLVKEKKNIWFLSITKLSYDEGLGAFCFDGEKVIHNYNKLNGLKNDRCYDIDFDRSGGIWFATYYGISNRNINGIWKHFAATKKDEPIQNINTICIDSMGVIWFNIGNSGVGYIDRTGLHESKVLTNYMIKEVKEIKVAEDNKLWITTLNGLYIYSNDNNNIVKRISKSDGLSNNKLWDFYLDRDSAVIGTFGNGLITYYHNVENDYFPLLFIHNLNVDYNKLSCLVSGYSYKSSIKTENIYYRYRIDGGKWSEFTNRKAIEIDNLKYGEHKLELQTYSVNGTLSQKIETVIFKVEPPLYRDLRFIVIVLIIAFYIFWLLNQNYKRKKHERESIKQLNLELEDKVEQKTKDLKVALEQLKIEQDKTELALKEEKDLHELKTKFIEMVSHEYRTPLTVIMSSAYIIEKLGIDSQKYGRIKEALVQIESAVNTLTGYIDDSLSLGTKPVALKSSTESSEVDLVEICKTIIEKQTKKENVFIDFKYDKNIIVKSNSDIITTIINNFINNSITYNRNNNTIELVLDYDGQYPSISVIDKGLGIEEKDQQELFKPFFRSKEHIGILPGTGLGLSISRKLAEDIGAQIVFESKLGIGSTFRLILPFD